MTAKKKLKVLARQQALDNGTQRRIIHGTVNAGYGSSSDMSYTGATVNPPPQYNFSGNFSGAVINTASGSMNHTNSNPNPVASFSRQKRKASDAIQFKRSDYEQIVDLCSDDEVVEAISGINSTRSFDEDLYDDAVEDVSSTRSSYSNEEKKNVVMLVRKHIDKFGGSRRNAIQVVQASYKKNPPTRSLIDKWEKKEANGEPFDLREVCPEFEKAVLAKLYRTEVDSTMCILAGEKVAKTPPFNKDPRVTRIKTFDQSWASRLLQRAKKQKEKTNTSSSTSAITASREVIVATVNETARSVVDAIPILTDAEIDVLGSEAEGVSKIKKAMQLRGDMRRSGYTKKNLPDLVQELKSIEETRRRAAPVPAPPAPEALPALTAPAPPAPAPPALVVPAIPVQRQYYCLPRCKCPLEGDADKEMIECENKDNCPHGQWYHFKCLKLLKTAKTCTWYCFGCEMSM